MRRASTINYNGRRESLAIEDNLFANMAPPRRLQIDVPAANSIETQKAEKVEGLGINFYDHKGQRVSHNSSPQNGAAAEATLGALTPRTQPPSTPSLIRLQTPVVSQKNEPSTPGSGKSNIELIEELLEENYRGQAESLYQSSSRASSLRSTPISSSRKASAPASVRPSPAFRTFSAPPNSPSIVYTPTRGSKVEHSEKSRILSCGTPTSNTTQEDQHSGNSGFSPDPLNTPPYNPQLYRIPASPTILKRSHRKQHPTPERGRLYFFESERQQIDLLVQQSTKTSCAEHDPCTDCTDKEYAYYENRAMSTQIPPERRQQIMKANRSLRNIKNVSMAGFVL